MNPLRRRNARAMWDLHYGPNMTPMVDVVMVILIFFMASASVLGPEWFLKTALPRSRATPQIDPTKEPVRLRIELAREGSGPTTASLDGGPAERLSVLPARVDAKQKAAAGAELIVLIAPSSAVPYDDVVRVHEVCFGTGITKVGLIDSASASPAPTPAPAPTTTK